MFKEALVLIAVFTVLLVSCEDNGNSTNGDDSGEGRMTAKINGEDWSSNSNIFAIEAGVARKPLRIEGEKNGETIELLLKFMVTDTIRPGTYPITPGGEDYFAVYRHDGISDTASSGEIVITQFAEEEKEILTKGSFNFTIMDGDQEIYRITDGEFDSEIE